MINHRHSLGEFLSDVSEYATDAADDLDTQVTAFLKDWENDRGFFGGEIWPCISEFEETEFQDEDIMCCILSIQEMETWKQYRHA